MENKNEKEKEKVFAGLVEEPAPQFCSKQTVNQENQEALSSFDLLK
jgi:hypothetical protein